MSRISTLTRRLLGVFLILTAACSRSDRTASQAAADSAAAPAAAVAVTPGGEVTLAVAARPGEAVYLTDASGRAVYYMAAPDGSAVVECTGDCATAFDPVTGTAVVAAGDTAVKATLIGQVSRPDGTAQVTYGGKPLYYHRGDQAGEPKGQGVKTTGGSASLINPNGEKVTARSP